MREDAINERRNFFLETLDKGLKEGRKEGRKEEKMKIAKSLLDILDIETIAIKTGLSVDEVKQLKEK
jgi:predicted transposase/invertase (TIGR01784 family)